MRRGIVLGVLAAVVAAAVAVVVLGPRVYRHFHGVELEPLSADSVTTPHIGGQTAYVAANEGPDRRPLLLFMHGHDADHSVLTLPRLHDFAQGLVDDGWVVATSDAHFNAWGSPSSQDDYAALYDRLRGQYRPSRVVVVSESMGAIAGLNMLAAHRLPGVDEWVGVSPVVDVQQATADPTLAAMIDGDTDSQQVEQRDPARLGGDFAGLRLVVAVASDDDTVPPSTGTDWAEAHDADVVTCTGGHVAQGCYDKLLPLLTSD